MINQVQIFISLSTTVLIIKQPKIYPRNRLPASPMKIEAGGKLNNKKPKHTIPKRKSITEFSLFPCKVNIISAAEKAISNDPDNAIPSIASIKLNTFINQTRRNKAKKIKGQ